MVPVQWLSPSYDSQSASEEERQLPGEHREDASDEEDDESVGTEAVDAQSVAEQDEWLVERISERRVIRGKQAEYKVHWVGHTEPTWEAESNVNDCAAYDQFLKEHPRTEPRRSARLASASSGELSDDFYTSGDASDEFPQAQMVMSALRCLQVNKEVLPSKDEQVIMSAVIKGVSALEDRTPKTLSEAMSSPDAAEWMAGRKKEYDSCVKMGVWIEVPRDTVPKGTPILKAKEVFKIKVDEAGNIAQFKVRFTPKGFMQREGIDFTETFARTAMYKTERVALSLAARFDHELIQFDVPTAFLNAPLQEAVFMELPPGLGQPGTVALLKKSLYGLKQSGRNWDQLVHGFITENMGWTPTVSDPSFYFKRSLTGRLMMMYRFVDDMQGQRNSADAAEFEKYADMLRKRFNIKKMETATWMLGMRITRNRTAHTIKLDQELYVTKALERFGLAECKVAQSPEQPGAANDTTPGMDAPADRQRFMEITGTLMYAAISTRADIAHAVHYLAANMAAPTFKHMQAAERVLRYLAGTKDVGLVFGMHNGGAVGDSRGQSTQVQVDVCAYADADWAGDRTDRKSISGWVAKLNGDPISWSSKKQRVVSLSTCEAELYAMSAAVQEVLWLRGLIAELGLNSVSGSSIVYGDNQSAIAVSKKGVKSNRTKHVDVKYHFITETIEDGKIKLVWVPSAQQQADIFTKALAPPVFLGLRRYLMSR